MITIRIALNTDIEEIQSLYRNTVLVINRRDYSQAEVEDWACLFIRIFRAKVLLHYC